MDYRYTYSSQQKWTPKEKLFLDLAVSYVSNYTGTDFLKDVCLFIGQSLQVTYTLISSVTEQDGNVAKTLVWTRGSDVLDNILYTLEGTPCKNALEYGICYYPDNVTSIFVEDIPLKELQINSYMGTALSDVKGERLGFIALMHEGKFADAALAEAFLTILTPSIEEEIVKHHKQW